MTIRRTGETGQWFSDHGVNTYQEVSSVVEILLKMDFRDAKHVEVHIGKGVYNLWYGQVDVWFNNCIGCKGLQHLFLCPEHQLHN